MGNDRQDLSGDACILGGERAPIEALLSGDGVCGRRGPAGAEGLRHVAPSVPHERGDQLPVRPLFPNQEERALGREPFGV